MCDRREPQILDRSECLQLLEGAHVGRLVFTRNSLPAVEPVRYVLDGCVILILTESGSELAQTVDNTVVAFEVDDVAADLREGWNVTGIGQAELVNQEHEFERGAQEFQVRDAGRPPHFIRINLQQLGGRRLPPALDADASDGPGGEARRLGRLVTPHTGDR